MLDGVTSHDSHGEERVERHRLARAQVAQSVEHVLGKDEVGGSSPLLGFFLAEAASGRPLHLSKCKYH
jgi:hypothetical protein